MEVKKCINCGTFITAEGNLCISCVNKICYEKTLLKNYFNENPDYNSITMLSETTGISPNTIKNYITENDYTSIELNDNDSFNQIPY